MSVRRWLCSLFRLPAYQPPIDKLDELDDTPGKIYVWHVDNEEKRNRWLKALADQQEQYGAFDAVHIVVTDTEELHRFDKSDLEAYLD